MLNDFFFTKYFAIIFAEYKFVFFHSFFIFSCTHHFCLFVWGWIFIKITHLETFCLQYLRNVVKLYSHENRIPKTVNEEMSIRFEASYNMESSNKCNICDFYYHRIENVLSLCHKLQCRCRFLVSHLVM